MAVLFQNSSATRFGTVSVALIFRPPQHKSISYRNFFSKLFNSPKTIPFPNALRAPTHCTSDTALHGNGTALTSHGLKAVTQSLGTVFGQHRDVGMWSPRRPGRLWPARRPRRLLPRAPPAIFSRSHFWAERSQLRFLRSSLKPCTRDYNPAGGHEGRGFTPR